MQAVTILNDASNAIPAPLPLQPVTDITNNISVDAQALISPPAAFTPGAHATPSMPAEDPLASPVRPTANRVTPVPSPMPPPSIGKQELNDAAMALTWLAEALTVPAAVSPMEPGDYTTAVDRRRKSGVNNTVTPYAASAGISNNYNSALYTTPLANTGSGNLRGRRAASQRCSTVVQDAIRNDRMLKDNLRPPQDPLAITPRNNATQNTPNTRRLGSRSSEAALAASAERKMKGYSENSRVGRAMVSILEYVRVHQPEYREVTAAGGVPERIIRQEFGNNPDTSKALRFLVSEKKIVRKGLGGRKDPFNYILARVPRAPKAATTVASETAAARAARVAAGGPDGSALTYSLYELEQIQRHVNIAVSHIETVGAAYGPAAMAAPASIGGHHLPSATPAAAAAALTAPSTGKWPTTAPRMIDEDLTMKARKQPSQPRLSLGMADPLAVEEGQAAALREAILAKQYVAGSNGGVIGMKRPAPTPKSVSFQADHVAKRPAQQQQQQQQELLGESPATAAAFLTPAPHQATQQQQQWTGPCPTQLPSGQRLASLASPPPLSTTTPAATNPVFLFPGAQAGTALSASQQQQQQQAAQAYIMQLKAAQMIWNHQVLAVQLRAAQAQQQQQKDRALAASQAGASAAFVPSQQQQQHELGATTAAAGVPSAAVPATVAATGTQA